MQHQSAPGVDVVTYGGSNVQDVLDLGGEKARAVTGGVEVETRTGWVEVESGKCVVKATDGMMYVCAPDALSNYVPHDDRDAATMVKDHEASCPIRNE